MRNTVHESTSIDKRVLRHFKNSCSVVNMSTEDETSTLGTNLKRLREYNGYSLRKLSSELATYGIAINADGLNRAEKGRRKVNTDELLALALVFDVSPLKLLLPPGRRGTTTQLTDNVSADAADVWRWALGRAPLSYPEDADDDERRRIAADFIMRNSPKSVPGERWAIDLTTKEGNLAMIQMLKDAFSEDAE
jgi:transcriptional regulator with XRE-family HTH domain